MGLRFRKSKKILPGVKLNVGKKSVGASFGGKAGGFSVNTKRGVTARGSIPGSGVSYTTNLTGGKEKKRLPRSWRLNLSRNRPRSPSPFRRPRLPPRPRRSTSTFSTPTP